MTRCKVDEIRGGGTSLDVRRSKASRGVSPLLLCESELWDVDIMESRMNSRSRLDSSVSLGFATKTGTSDLRSDSVEFLIARLLKLMPLLALLRLLMLLLLFGVFADGSGALPLSILTVPMLYASSRESSYAASLDLY